MKTVNPSLKVPFSLKEEEELPPEERTTIQCYTLTVEEHAYLQDMSSVGQMMVTALDFGLAEIVPFKDEDGNNIELVRDKAKKPILGKYPWKRSCLDRIPADARTQIANFILSGTKLKEAEAKNS